MLEIKIDGLEEVKQALKQLPEKLQRKYMAQAVKAGAEVIAQSARARCPVSTKGTQRSRYQSRIHDPGNLKRAIKVYTTKLSEVRKRSKYWGMPLAQIRHESLLKIAGVYIMRKTPYDAWYWHMVAGGHRVGKGQGFVKANPFLRDAFTTNEQRVVNMISAKLNMAIQNARTTL